MRPKSSQSCIHHHFNIQAYIYSYSHNHWNYYQIWHHLSNILKLASDLPSKSISNSHYIYFSYYNHEATISVAISLKMLISLLQWIHLHFILPDCDHQYLEFIVTLQYQIQLDLFPVVLMESGNVDF